MKIWINIMMIFILISPLSSHARDHLSFAIFPYVSANKMVSHHNSLRLYLEKSLKVSIDLETARNVQKYINNVKQEKYDLIFTAPHIGRLSENKAHYQRVAKTDHFIQGVFITRKESPIESLEDISGKTLGIAGFNTVLSQVAMKQLNAMDKQPYKNIQVLKTATHNNAMYTALNKESDFSLTGNTLWANFPPEHKAKLKEIGTTHKIPGFMVMANSALPKSFIANIKKALFAFAQTPEGKQYIFNGFKPITEADMKFISPYAANL